MNPVSNVAEVVSGESERTLSEEEDDYTASTGNNSYYFRGNVLDNYVEFAGLCWRIVRIEGDGSVKLILEDATYECDNESFTGNWSDGQKYAYGNDINSRPNFIDNVLGVNVLADSFKTFQTTLETKIAATYIDETIADKLKVDEWCFDNNIAEIADDNYEYYATYRRLQGDKTASLKCTGTKISKFNDDSDMYVATLTADEIAYAGASTSESNNSFYLMNSYSLNNLYWWSLSPSVFYNVYGDPYAYNLNAFGKIDGYGSNPTVASISNETSSRPAVTLKAGTKIVNGGTGTKTNPYVVSVD